MKTRIISILLVLALVVAMMAVGPAAMAKKGNKGKKAKKAKVTLCHNAGQENQQTIVVGKPAAKAHMAHGDTVGACQPLPAP